MACPPEVLTLNLEIDDRVHQEILRGLYYPESPYEFSVISADILGQVYEQFLGQVIKLTPAHRAVVEEKPEIKKAGGIYYTLKYIVDYIVRQTVRVRPEEVAGACLCELPVQFVRVEPAGESIFRELRATVA